MPHLTHHPTMECSTAGLEQRALDLAMPGGEQMDPCGGSRGPTSNLGSLGRNRNHQHHHQQHQQQHRPRQVVTTGSTNHVLYTDQKGRKIPHNDTSKNTTNHVKRLDAFLNNQNKHPKSKSNIDSRLSSSEDDFAVKIGIYGWRKKCLYLLILILLFIIIINFILILWVLKVMDFNLEGMGQMKIIPGGVQLVGQAMALDSLYASSIRSRRGQAITLESSRNFSINVRDEEGYLSNRLFLGGDKIEYVTNGFKMTDLKGATVFSANQDEVFIGADTLRTSGSGGISIDGSLQTPLVRSSPGQTLQFESPTRSMEVKAAQSVNLESRAGDLTATCVTTLKLQSVAGAIKLEASNVLLPKLKSALPLPTSSSHSRDSHHHDIYQLCACGNGKLFLASPHGVCAAKEDSYICR